MNKMKSKFLRWSAALLVAGIAGNAWAAQSDEAFFHGRTVKLVVGYSPGGGYDVYAHLLAPFLSKYLGATVIVDNEPGAGGLRALDDTYVAPADGLQIMIVKGNAASMAQMTGQSGVRYDLSKISMLGGTGLSPDVWMMSPKSPIKSVSDALKANSLIRWAATGPMDGLSDGASIVCRALTLQCKVIMGYTGTNDAALALGRGEMDALIANEASANSYVKANNAQAVASISLKRSRYFPDLPTIYEEAKLTPDAKWWVDFRTNSDILGRILVAPPGMKPERLKILQDAIQKSLQDPEMIAQGAKTQHFVEYQDPASIHAAALKILDQTSDEDKARIKSVVVTKE